MTHQRNEELWTVQVSEAHFQSFANEDGCWYESRADVDRAIAATKRKAALLRWVCHEMGRKLSPRERTCLELYYFDALPLREVGERTGISGPSASRTIRRAIVKLRRAAREAGVQPRRCRGRW